MDQDQILSIQDLNYEVNGRLILDSVNLALSSRDYLAVIGPNGGGKSTLINHIVGLLRPTSGSIRIFDTSPEKARAKIGYLPQYAQFDHEFPISVLEVVLMATLSNALFSRTTAADIDEAMEKLTTFGVANLKDRNFCQLSGGERQRVLLARAMMKSPNLLILDEPTTGVDAKAQAEFYESLSHLNKDLAIIMVSHDLSAVSQYVKNIACLNQKCVYHGTKELNEEDLSDIYGCHVDLIAHGHPHRVMKNHD